MKISQLRKVLDQFADVHGDADTTGRAAALRRLTDVLETFDNMTTDAVVKKVLKNRSVDAGR